MKRNRTLLFIVVSVLLISIFVFAGCSFVTDSVSGAGSAPSQTIGRHDIDINNMESPSIGEVVANNCLEAVCMITATNGSVLNPFVTSGSLGSGFFVNESGYIVTNAHVVEGKDHFLISTAERQADGKVVMSNKSNASLVAKDTELDLAILKLGSPNKVQYLTFAKEPDVAYGQTVFTIGNPNGLFFSMISGMVANPAYKVEEKGAYEHIVLDANINHGNSGGALINAHSYVVGVIDARLEGSTPGKENDVYGLGLAIPAPVVKRFLKSYKVPFYVEEVKAEQTV